MLAKNVLYNLFGLLAPVALAIFCIPPLIRALGTEAFGLLTLVWIVLGYFSIFDLGIGRALTLAVANSRAGERRAEINPLVTTGAVLTFGLGLLGAVLLAALAGMLARQIAGGSASLQAATYGSLLAIACALPFVTATAALRGVLEAHDRFDITSAIRVAMGFITYGGPLLIVEFEAGLLPVVVFLACARVITFGVHVVAALRVVPARTTSPFRPARAHVRPLLVLGGWMSVSNVISPALSYLDRFLAASIVGAATIAYYTTPYEAISRLTMVPEAVLGVLFPTLGAALALDRERAARLYGQCLRALLAVLLPIACFVLVFSRELMAAWISPEFAAKSHVILQLLCVGIVVNSIARLPYTALHSAGRPDLTAKLHLVELPVFVGVLYVLTSSFGIVGTALAWSLRATVDFFCLHALQRKVVGLHMQIRWAGTTFALGLIIAAAALRLPTIDLAGTIWISGIVVAVLPFLCWAFVLGPAEQHLIRSVITKRLHRR